jgi:hypothetical protein
MRLDLDSYLPFYVTVVQNILPPPGPLSRLLNAGGDESNSVLRPRQQMSVVLLTKALLKQSPEGMYFYRNGHIRLETPVPPTMCTWKGSLARTRKKILDSLADLGPCLLLVDDYQHSFTVATPPNVQLCTLMTMRRHVSTIHDKIIVVDRHLPGIDFEERPSPHLVQLQFLVARSAGYLGYLPKNNSMNQTRAQLYLLGTHIDESPPKSTLDILGCLETMRFHQCL